MDKTLLLFIFSFTCGFVKSQIPELNYFILEELSPQTLICNIPIDAKLNIKYNDATLRNLQFKFLGQAGLNQDLFLINQDTGIIRTAKKIDRDTYCPQQEICVIDLDVVVQPVEYFEIIKLRINILDINDHRPQFPTKTLDFQISESSLPGASFSIPAARDPDSAKYSIKKYKLADESDVFELFESTSPDEDTDVRLVLKRNLDRETTSFYQLVVLALDGDSEDDAGNLTVNIHIKDANDNNPVFANSSYETEVDEDAPVGTTFIYIKAVDPDAEKNGEIVYLFAQHTINLYGQIFGINNKTGGLYLKRSLDYESGQVYTLSLRAHDKGQDSTPAQATVVVRVKDINDNAPQISINTLTASGDAEITENTGIGTFVAHISILDPDSGDNGIVTCTLNDTKFNLKSLFKTEYKIITTQVFDREKEDKYIIALRCSDMGIPAQVITQIMMVNILDENDNPPKFVQDVFYAKVLENSPIGTPVVVVNASDEDSQENSILSYQLHNNADNKFLINSHTGAIVTHAKFDYELIKEVQFYVLVRDNGKTPFTATATVIVKVLDTDDEKPEFLKENFFFKTQENQPVGSIVGKVTVNDADSKPYNEFYITWNDNLQGVETAKEHFDVDPISGTISLRKVLDREEKSLYQFGLKAVSKTSLNFIDITFVTVYVDDLNDNAPVIDFPNQENNTIYVWTETTLHSVLTRIRASDPDSGNNAKMIYSIAHGDQGHLFDIDQETGALTLQKLIPGNVATETRLQIFIRDKGRPSRSNSAHLNVKFTSEPSPELTGVYSSSRQQKGQIFDQVTMIIVATLGGLAGLLCIIVIAAVIHLKRRRKPKKEKCGTPRETQLMLNQGKAAVEQDMYSSSHQRVCTSMASSCILCTRHKTLMEDSFSSASSGNSQFLETSSRASDVTTRRHHQMSPVPEHDHIMTSPSPETENDVYMVMRDQGCCQHSGLLPQHRSVSSCRIQRQLPDPPARVSSPCLSTASSCCNHRSEVTPRTEFNQRSGVNQKPEFNNMSEADLYGSVKIHKNHNVPFNKDTMFIPIADEYSTPVDSTRNNLGQDRVTFGVKFLGQTPGQPRDSDSGISDACLDVSPQSTSSEDPEYSVIPHKIRKTQKLQTIEDIHIV